MVVKRCATVWEGLQQIFGPSFVTLYGDTPSTLWVNAIAGLTDGEVEAGLLAVSKDCRDYPPNLTEWVDYCKPKKPVRYLGRPMTRSDMRKLLDGPRAKPEHRDAMLSKMRATVKAAKANVAERTLLPPLANEPCTCKAMGTCPVCLKLMGILHGDVVEREPGSDDDLGEVATYGRSTLEERSNGN